jgi:hypothetical protein
MHKNIFSVLSATDDDIDNNETDSIELEVDTMNSSNIESTCSSDQKSITHQSVLDQQTITQKNMYNYANNESFVSNRIVGKGNFVFRNNSIENNKFLNSKNGNRKSDESYSNKFNKNQRVPNKNYEKKKPIKRILCKNVIDGSGCDYKLTCLYAHNLDDQNIDNNRKQAVEFLKNKNNLDIEISSSMYDLFLLYTKVCSLCIINKCVGGYNCKFGAPVNELVVCMDDLISGDCGGLSKNSCDKIHLTQRGFIPSSEYQKNNSLEEFPESALKKSDLLFEQDAKDSFFENIDKDVKDSSEIYKLINNMEEKVYDSNFLNNPSIIASNEYIPSNTHCIVDGVTSGKRDQSKSDVIDKQSMDIIINNSVRHHEDEEEIKKQNIAQFYKINKEEEEW